MSEPELKPGMWVDCEGQKFWLVGISDDGRRGALESDTFHFATALMNQLKPWRQKRTVTVPEFWTLHNRETMRLDCTLLSEPTVQGAGQYTVHHPARTVEIENA